MRTVRQGGKGRKTQPVGEREYLSVAEVAEYLGLSERTVYERCRRNSMPGAIRIGERWIIRRLDLDLAMAEMVRGKTSPAKVA